MLFFQLLCPPQDWRTPLAFSSPEELRAACAFMLALARNPNVRDSHKQKLLEHFIVRGPRPGLRITHGACLRCNAPHPNYQFTPTCLRCRHAPSGEQFVFCNFINLVASHIGPEPILQLLEICCYDK